MLEHLKDLASNYVLIATLSGWFSAQFFKMLVTLIKDKSLDLRLMLFSTGGMPSSHSSTVCSLFSASAILYGFGSFQFAVCFTLAVIVMTDAVGVRQETGKQAKILNRIIEEMFSGDHEKSEKALKELVGHTPFQVAMGALVGIGTAITVAFLMNVL